MKTFKEFHELDVQEGIMSAIKSRFKKKPKPGMRPYRSGASKDSPHYNTDHHYNHGDIEPSDIPIYKPTWQNMH